MGSKAFSPKTVSSASKGYNSNYSQNYSQTQNQNYEMDLGDEDIDFEDDQDFIDYDED